MREKFEGTGEKDDEGKSHRRPKEEGIKHSRSPVMTVSHTVKQYFVRKVIMDIFPSLFFLQSLSYFLKNVHALYTL